MKILYEDDTIIVCYKEAGLAVQSANIRVKDLESMLRTHLMEQRIVSGKGSGTLFLGVVHRLDQPVEGLVVFAKTKEAAAFLSAQVTDGRMRKEYLAVCAVTGEAGKRSREIQGAGSLAEPWDTLCQGSMQEPARTKHEVTLVDYLLKDPRTNISRVVSKETKGAKRAELSYFVTGKYADDADTSMDTHDIRKSDLPGRESYVIVKVRLKTGRHHQIRVQLSHAGLPIAGDARYARHIPALPGYPYPALCAARLSFMHPQTKEQMTFSALSESPVFQEKDCDFRVRVV